MQTTFTVETRGSGLVEITRTVAQWVAGAGLREGLLTLFVRHTSCSLLIQENADPDVRTDLVTALRTLAPQDAPWVHDTEGPDDMPAHIKAALNGISLHVPVQDGAMALGTWQGIFLFEHRRAAHRRDIAAHVLGDDEDAA